MNPRQKGSYGRSSFEKDSAYAMGIYMGYTYHIYGLCKDPEITMAIYG
jgi:hypothetical protein